VRTSQMRYLAAKALAEVGAIAGGTLIEEFGRFLETANPFCGHVRRAACDRNGLAVRLPASHMTVSQAGPTGSMTPWR
jgi:hypothetical protein